ncbi:leucine--tRNA ligase, domain 2 protein [Leptospira interrogans str. 2002000626]|uniref:leucine--tRNA ligase n=1 Tax=Leptospira interrogans str. 2002000626 TaxID=996803 RepID=A0A829DDW2_LEPIR|nr:leucine--tRNA ligase, domain 2 protein [Leptospira interrogans str. 2002000626]
MRQYMMRITAYADRLLEDLELVEWPPSTLEMQKNWIGKSEGLEITFPFLKPLQSGLEGIRIFTTRPDTIFGVTYMVVAPEHPIVSEITTPEQKQKVEEYQKTSSLKSDLDRMELNKKKQGFLQELLFLILQILLKKFRFGSAIMCYTDTEQERSWPFRLMIKETLSLQEPSD